MSATPPLRAHLHPETPAAPPIADALYAVGHDLLTRDAPRTAAPVFRLMLSCAPADERGWLGLGRCHEMLDQPDVALEVYASASLAADPAPRCQLARARLLRAVGRHTEAVDACDAARALARAIGDSALEALAIEESVEPDEIDAPRATGATEPASRVSCVG